MRVTGDQIDLLWFTEWNDDRLNTFLCYKEFYRWHSACNSNHATRSNDSTLYSFYSVYLDLRDRVAFNVSIYPFTRTDISNWSYLAPSASAVRLLLQSQLPPANHFRLETLVRSVNGSQIDSIGTVRIIADRWFI